MPMLRVLSLLCVVLPLANPLWAQSKATRLAPGKGWHSDLAAGTAIAAKTGKPIMLVFRCDP